MLTVQGRVRKADSSCCSSSLATPHPHGRLRATFGAQPFRLKHDTNPARPPRPSAAASAQAQAQPGSPASTTPSSPPSAPTCPRAKSRSWRCFRTAARPATSSCPVMKKLKASLPANAQLVYLPASWNKAEAWPMFQRAYLTAQSLGVAEKAHDAMFQAIWTTGELGVDRTLRTPQEEAADHRRRRAVLRARRGREGRGFRQRLEVLQRRSQDAPGRRQIIAMQVSGTPTLVVNGKYRVNNENLQTNDEMIELVKFLVAKESAAARGRGARQEGLSLAARAGGASTAAAPATPATPAPR